MKTITTADALRQALTQARKAGRGIGFVPTMGALHAGHMALIDTSVNADALTVASIFVNPTQFNENTDLKAYPRTPEADARLLENHGCDLLYLPDQEDIYPDGTDASLAAGLDFGQLTATMEGANRPGHFEGMAQVVSRLLTIVEPDNLYMGQKDYQQVAVVRSMLRQLGLAVKLHCVATVREADGLAMSSRNRRLSPDERLAAGTINRQLTAVLAGLEAGWSPRELEKITFKFLADHPLLEPEYVEVFHGNTLLTYDGGPTDGDLAVATAVRVGPVRLIDNRITVANPR